MIGGEPGVVWFYDNTTEVKTFSDGSPLNVLANQCGNVSVCLWYVSPVIGLSETSNEQYALLGEWNKWTAVSQQRFTSIETDRRNSRAVITVQGVADEVVPVVVYHSTLLSVIVNCHISTMNGQAQLVITTNNVVCS